MKSIRITILAAGLTLQGFANAPLEIGKTVNAELTRAALSTKSREADCAGSFRSAQPAHREGSRE